MPIGFFSVTDMKLLITTFIILGCTVFSLAQQKKDTFESIKRNSSNSVKLVFKTKPFSRGKRKIEVIDKNTMIDGRFALGTYGNTPSIEIESIGLFWNDVEIPVPKKFYADCFEPDFEGGNFRLKFSDENRIKFSDDGESLMAFMAGGNAAGGYMIYWIFRKDGNHSRFSKPCSDCQYTDFTNGFFGN